MALEQPARVGRLVLMGPAASASRRRRRPTAQRLLSYYAGEGPTLDKLRAFICGDLVYDASRISEGRSCCERFRIEHPARGDGQPAAASAEGSGGLPRLDFLLPPAAPTLVIWGAPGTASTRPAAPPRCSGADAVCDTVMFSRTGHWAQGSARRSSTHGQRLPQADA